MYSGNKNIKSTFLIKRYFATYVAFSSSIKIVYIYILTLSAFFIECQIFCSNSTRHFFKTVIYRILRIFNGLDCYKQKVEKSIY